MSYSAPSKMQQTQ